jgi:Flp pilus assembly protein TadG
MGLTALVGATGLAVDTTRVWLVETRLKTAVDAAALTAARRMNDATRDADARAVFWAHFTQFAGETTFLGATITNPTITPLGTAGTQIRVEASATIRETLFGVLSNKTVTRTEAATVERSGTGLELAIVLDQTSSMLASAGSGQGTKLDAAKAAVRTMLDVLYAGRDTQRNLFVSVVPFARSINIGTGNAGWLDTSGLSAGWSQAAWTGCVEARRNGHDTTDAAPTGAARFRPWFWVSTYRQVGTVASGRCTATNAYPGTSNSNRYCHGDNDWTVNGVGPTQTDLNANYMYDYLRDQGFSHANAIGPNLMCAMNAIQPLTASRTTVEAALTAIQAPVKSGGTTTAVGLQGAWYTLSPNWQGYWQNPNAGLPNIPTLPLPYATPNMRKVVVMLTDGDNNWQTPYQSNSSYGCGTTSGSYRYVCAALAGASSANELLYNAYGRVGGGLGYNQRFPSATINPITQTNADTRLNDRFTATCNAMKATNVGITIYMIGFEVSSSDRSRLQACATSAQHYLESPTPSTLSTVFRQVGNQLASVRMTD